MITFTRGSIHQAHEVFSEHSRGRQCAFMSFAGFSVDWIPVDSQAQASIDDILCHGDDFIYMH